MSERLARVPRAFVSGPLLQGDSTENVRRALLAAAGLRALGFIVHVPHLKMLADLVAPRSRAEWLAESCAWVEVCDVVVRLPGASDGADAECATARALGIPVVEQASDVEPVLVALAAKIRGGG